MAPRKEASHKRARLSQGDADSDTKKPRRSERLSQRVDALPDGLDDDNDSDDDTHLKTPVSHKHQLSTVSTYATTSSEDATSEQGFKEPTATPPEGRPSQMAPRGGAAGGSGGGGGGNTTAVDGVAGNSSTDDIGPSSPLQDTQAFPSQLLDPKDSLRDQVEDEVKEGVWGYLLPLDARYGTRSIVLKRRPAAGDDSTAAKKDKMKAAPKQPGAAGYLIGRHPECDVVVNDLIVSNRHCLLFSEHKGHDTIAVLEDLSSNGTYVNEALVGKYKRRELQDKDEITVLDKARFVFRYPRSRTTSAFSQQYTLLNCLGKGHFAEVYLCVENATGQRYAVKIFTKVPGVDDRSKTDGLQQEIAVLMSVSHPNVLSLKDTFYEQNAVYLVLELAPEGELFNFIIMNEKLSEDMARRLFKQLFAGVKYLHERNIVHRDIKPENILLIDRDLHAKIADFGLAKIIGEESFTTTLCGTPSYVAPEVLADSRHRQYSKAVDVWSLGVVLYICLCGFPPFSDELTSPAYPYTLSDQIRSARFNYPSPYWDSVGDPALELIDNMLTVDPAKRFTIDQCLAHPWMQMTPPDAQDSTLGLVGGVAGLQVDRRGPVEGGGDTGGSGSGSGFARQRTLLSAVNQVEITRVPGGQDRDPIKIFSRAREEAAAAAATAAPQKKAKSKAKDGASTRHHHHQQPRPADGQDPGVFMGLGDAGDPVLFTADGSVYVKQDVAQRKKGKAGKTGKGKKAAR